MPYHVDAVGCRGNDHLAIQSAYKVLIPLQITRNVTQYGRFGHFMLMTASDWLRSEWM